MRSLVTSITDTAQQQREPIRNQPVLRPSPPSNLFGKTPRENMARTVRLQSADGVTYDVDVKVAEQSILLKNMMEDIGEDITDTIPVPNVQSNVLKKVLDYCEHHKQDPASASSEEGIARAKANEISQWDQKFLQVDQEMLFEIILTANYLDIRPLLEVGCRTVANMIKNKSPDEIRKTFNIQNDFTPEEEAQIRREHEWAQDR